MLKIGWAEENITPNQKIKLAGQFFERISEYVETPITVTAMAVETEDDAMVICACDLVSIGENLIKAVRDNVSGEKGLNPEKIIICATHTHTSFVYERKDNSTKSSGTTDYLKELLPEGKTYKERVTAGADVLSPNDALHFLTKKITQAILSAWESRDEAQYACGFGRAAVGMCRRVCYDDGSAKMWGNVNTANFTHLEGGNDSGIELMYTFDTQGKLRGVVANIACPSQVVEHRSFISSDYWGKVRILLREKFGDDLYILGLCSAAGDQCPRDMIRWVEPETPIDDPNIKRENPPVRRADPSMFDIRGTWKIGKRIANEIAAVYEEIEEKQSTAYLAHRVLKLNMPLRRVTVSDYEAAKSALQTYLSHADEIDFNDKAMMHVHAGTILRFREQQEKDIVPIEVHVVRFGDVVFATNPYELFLDYGNQIRARSQAAQTFLIQLACGSHTYLPTEKAEKGGHYSAYVSSGDTGHVGGEILVRETVEAIRTFFQS